MTLYETIREEMLGKNEDGTIPVWKAVVGGCVAGMTAQFLASPAGKLVDDPLKRT